ncbi:hypothetical protein [Actinomadura vinacea]|uniref:hypothetical protein n=1 Tax=Actinomadura vinacea TaxID=115336 RepID=UPI003CD0AD9C
MRRSRIDLRYLHNPEYGRDGDRHHLLREITAAFAACEQAAAAGRIGGYGVATWNGFAHEAFTMADLVAAARNAAGGQDTCLAAVQLPISLVQIKAIAAAASGHGTVVEAAARGLEVWASAPLHGGELGRLVNDELARLIQPGLTPVQAALHVVASTPGLSGAVLSASTPAHWNEAATAFSLPPVPPARLREICAVLRA